MNKKISFVYRIFKEKEFMNFRVNKKFGGNQLDIHSGFIHLSTYEQIKGTLTKYFEKNNNIFISKIRVSDLQDSLKWEKGRDSQIFPHFYGILKFKFIVKTVKREDIHEF